MEHSSSNSNNSNGCCVFGRAMARKKLSATTPKWKLLILVFVSILVLVAAVATRYRRIDRGQTSLGLFSPEDGSPIPTIFREQLEGSPLQANTENGLVSTETWFDYEENNNHHHHTKSPMTNELRFLIETLSPIVSQISERDGTQLTDFIASRWNDETIVLKGSPQHNALVWLSHAIVCQDQSNNNTDSNNNNNNNSNNSAQSSDAAQNDCVSLLSRSQLLNRYSLGTMYFAWNGKSWENAQGWLSYHSEIEYPPTPVVSRSSKSNYSTAIVDMDLDEVPQKRPSDVCLWKGVTCRHEIEGDRNEDLAHYGYGRESSDTDHDYKAGEQIVGLDFSGNNLVGYIGAVKELRLLEYLEAFNLSHNYLEGLVPTEVGMLEELITLDLSHNLLSGTLPVSIPKNLTNLEVFRVQDNFLVGGLEEFLPCASATWKEFSADCLGARPKVECPCCTICCRTSTNARNSSSSLRGTIGEQTKNETIVCREQVPEE